MRCEKYYIGNDNCIYYKILNKNEKIVVYKIPYIFEPINLFQINHDKKGHISYKPVIEEIKSSNYYWKTIYNDYCSYITKCPVCL